MDFQIGPKQGLSLINYLTYEEGFELELIEVKKLDIKY